MMEEDDIRRAVRRIARETVEVPEPGVPEAYGETEELMRREVR